MLGEADTNLAELFARYDEKPDRAALNQIRATLNRRKYVSNLLRDVEKELNVHSAN
jgi:hypothetical protein